MEIGQRNVAASVSEWTKSPFDFLPLVATPRGCGASPQLNHQIDEERDAFT